jgi:large subunit ribosomal protein L6
MSRVGKVPIKVEQGVNVIIENGLVKISGPNGELHTKIHQKVKLTLVDDKICVAPVDDTTLALSMWGTTRSIVSNMVQGVKNGFKIELELVGVGYRVAQKDNFINLAVGKSHSVRLVIPNGIKVSVPKPTHIIMEAADKELLGQFAAVVIKQRPTEPFKGKGIKFKDQFIKKKEGKKN